MTQQETATARKVHITISMEVTPTCPTLCGDEADFKDCLTIEQYREFKRNDRITQSEWCGECSEKHQQGGILFIASNLGKKRPKAG